MAYSDPYDDANMIHHALVAYLREHCVEFCCPMRSNVVCEFRKPLYIETAFYAQRVASMVTDKLACALFEVRSYVEHKYIRYTLVTQRSGLYPPTACERVVLILLAAAYTLSPKDLAEIALDYAKLLEQECPMAKNINDATAKAEYAACARLEEYDSRWLQGLAATIALRVAQFRGVATRNQLLDILSRVRKGLQENTDRTAWPSVQPPHIPYQPCSIIHPYARHDKIDEELLTLTSPVAEKVKWTVWAKEQGMLK